jgi:hypothetical protein
MLLHNCRHHQHHVLRHANSTLPQHPFPRGLELDTIIVLVVMGSMPTLTWSSTQAVGQGGGTSTQQVGHECPKEHGDARLLFTVVLR